MGNAIHIAAPFSGRLFPTESRDNEEDERGHADVDWPFHVLGHCDEPSRAACACVCRRLARAASTDASFRWRLGRLHVERGVYHPPVLPDGLTWRSLHAEQRGIRDLWEGGDEGGCVPRPEGRDGGDGRFSIRVCTRFRPPRPAAGKCQDPKPIVLPLHQRLGLIKMSNNFSSNRDALEILKQQGDWFGKQTGENAVADADTDGRDEKTSNEKDKTSYLAGGIHDMDAQSGIVVVADPTRGLAELEFDRVFDCRSSQEAVYSSSASMLVCDFINGYNATCIVYGQTGSGKSHTMFGPCGDSGSARATCGIVPRACREVLCALDYRSRGLNFEIRSSVSVSYVQIFGNEVTDLLKKGRPCGRNRAAAQRYVLDGAAEVKMQNLDDLKNILDEGEKYKKKAATAMNEHSSRAHTLVILTLKQKRQDSGISITSRLFMVDLGGSEDTKKSKIEIGKSNHVEALKKNTETTNIDQKAEGEEDLKECCYPSRPEEKSTIEKDSAIASSLHPDSNEDIAPPKVNSIGFVMSDRMREAVCINQGLFALKRCVEALNAGLPHVPYASSKLTAMLSAGLGGDGKTTVVVCASPDASDAAESVSTLRFGWSCRRIKKEAATGRSGVVEEILQKIDADIRECEELIVRKERWEVRVEERRDELAEKGTMEADGFGGKEVRKITTLVGAEKERLRLNRLLVRRAELTGTNLESAVSGSRYGGDIGFGDAEKYGIGRKYRSGGDDEELERFAEKVSPDEIPSTVFSGGNRTGWTNDASGNSNDEENTKKRRKHRLAYAGISA